MKDKQSQKIQDKLKKLEEQGVELQKIREEMKHKKSRIKEILDLLERNERNTAVKERREEENNEKREEVSEGQNSGKVEQLKHNLLLARKVLSEEQTANEKTKEIELSREAGESGEMGVRDSDNGKVSKRQSPAILSAQGGHMIPKQGKSILELQKRCGFITTDRGRGSVEEDSKSEDQQKYLFLQKLQRNLRAQGAIPCYVPKPTISPRDESEEKEQLKEHLTEDQNPFESASGRLRNLTTGRPMQTGKRRPSRQARRRQFQEQKEDGKKDCQLSDENDEQETQVHRADIAPAENLEEKAKDQVESVRAKKQPALKRFKEEKVRQKRGEEKGLHTHRNEGISKEQYLREIQQLIEENTKILIEMERMEEEKKALEKERARERKKERKRLEEIEKYNKERAVWQQEKQRAINQQCLEDEKQKLFQDDLVRQQERLIEREKQLIELTEELKQLKIEYCQAQAKWERENENLKNEFKEYNEKSAEEIKERDQREKQMKEKLEELEKALYEAKEKTDCKKQIEDGEGEIKLQQERDSLAHKLIEERDKYEELKKEMNNLKEKMKERIAAIKASKEQIQLELERMRDKERSEKQTSNELWKADLESIQMERERERKEFLLDKEEWEREKKETLKELEDERERFREYFERLEAEITSRKKEQAHIQKVRAELEREKKRALELEKECEKNKNELAALLSKLAKETNMNNELRMRIEEFEKQVLVPDFVGTICCGEKEEKMHKETEEKRDYYNEEKQRSKVSCSPMKNEKKLRNRHNSTRTQRNQEENEVDEQDSLIKSIIRAARSPHFSGPTTPGITLCF